MAGLKLDTSNFDKVSKYLVERTRQNAYNFAQSAAHSFQSTAQAQAPWTNNRGIARARLYGKASQSGDRTRIEMGGSAPNYKQYKNAEKRYPDYLELLEFANGGKYAIVFPTRDALVQDIQARFGSAVLNGGTVRISRSAVAAKARGSKRRAK